MMPMTVKTRYSQGEEQDHILANVPATGRFLDIGSWHPTVFSNVRALLENGWSGVMIEPAPGPFINLLRACVQCGDVPVEPYGERKSMKCDKCGGPRYGDSYPQIILIQAAVSCEKGLVLITATDDALSSSNQKNIDTWGERGGFYGKFLVPAITMQQIANQFGGDFSFVNIDAEGSSGDLFHALLATGMRPNCICVEHDGRIVELDSAAKAAGYRQVYMNGENLIFAQ